MFAVPKGGRAMCDRSDVSGIYIIGKLEMTGLENEQEQMESVVEKNTKTGGRRGVNRRRRDSCDGLSRLEFHHYCYS